MTSIPEKTGCWMCGEAAAAVFLYPANQHLCPACASFFNNYHGLEAAVISQVLSVLTQAFSHGQALGIPSNELKELSQNFITHPSYTLAIDKILKGDR